MTALINRYPLTTVYVVTVVIVAWAASVLW